MDPKILFSNIFQNHPNAILKTSHDPPQTREIKPFAARGRGVVGFWHISCLKRCILLNILLRLNDLELFDLNTKLEIRFHHWVDFPGLELFMVLSYDS